MNDIDKWAAEQSGITFQESMHHTYWREPNGEHHIESWTIKDPRCREIVRKAKGIHTMQLDNDQWYSWSRETGSTKPYDDLDDAEIACIQAIYEKGQENE